MMRRPLAAIALVLATSDCWSADLRVAIPTDPPLLFAPAAPIGVGSEVPRSRLADVLVNGGVRFEVRSAAVARCPRDVVVWTEATSNFYRTKPRPGPADAGAYMCQADASTEGDRPDPGRSPFSHRDRRRLEGSIHKPLVGSSLDALASNRLTG